MFTIHSRGVAQQHGSEIEEFVARVHSCRTRGTDLWWNYCYTHWLFDASNTVLLLSGKSRKALAQMRRGPTSSTSRRKQRRWQHTNLKPQERIRRADSMSEFVLNNCLRMKQSSKLEECLSNIHIAVPWNSEPAASASIGPVFPFFSLSWQSYICSSLQYEGEEEPCSCMSRGPGRFNPVRQTLSILDEDPYSPVSMRDAMILLEQWSFTCDYYNRLSLLNSEASKFLQLCWVQYRSRRVYK